MTPAQIAYLQLVTSHQALLLGYIRSVAPGVAADDVLQETNIVLWNKIDSFEINSNFKAFACRVAYLKTMESLRKSKRNQWLVFDSDIIEEINTHYSSKTDAKDDTQYALRQCMAKLDDSERELIHLRYTKGKTVRSIAKKTEQSEGALQQLFFRIRNALRSCIGNQLSEIDSQT